MCIYLNFCSYIDRENDFCKVLIKDNLFVQMNKFFTETKANFLSANLVTWIDTLLMIYRNFGHNSLSLYFEVLLMFQITSPNLFRNNLKLQFR